MDLRYGKAYEEFRDEVKAFLADHWPPKGDDAGLERSVQAARFRERAIARGYLARAIPVIYGGSEQEPDVLKAAILREEFRAARAPGEMRGIGPGMLVPTLLDHGTEWQKERFIRPTLTGELIWCQGYSEPGSGSDLASLTTRAERVGDAWVINGQKIWTSAAHLAGMMFILCRTEPGASKHAGISYLLVNMKQPGIEVQPLRQMTGDTTFNQVFLSDARTPADHIVGKRGEGWLVSRSTLKHERNSIGSAANVRALFESLVRLAHRQRRNGRSALEDPVIRQRLVEIDGYVTAHECSGYRQLTCDARGASPGLVGMMNKLVSTNVGHLMAKLALEIVDADGLRAPASRRIVGDVPDRSNAWVGQVMNSLGAAIAGGTANIQRNIIAERGLGLPRDWAAQRSRS